MKKLSVFFSMMVVAAFLALNLTSCGTDPEEEEPAPIPTIQIMATPDGYDAIIAVQSENATSLTWEYGDGNTATEAPASSHTYTYEASGDYTITVTATGEGGTASASADVSIAASIEEMIAGVGDEGKTWVLTQADGAGKMGVGHVENDLAIIEGYDVIPPLILYAFGLGDEYEDEFTFYNDGTFTIDVKNDTALASALYGGVLAQMGTEVKMSNDVGSLPLSGVPFANVNDGTWSLSYEEFSIMAQNEIDIPEEEQVLVEKTFTFTEGETRARLVLSPGSYIGFFDMAYPAIEGMLPQAEDNSFYIMTDVTPDAMHIAVASCGLQELLIYPTYMLHLTFVPKQ